MRPPTPSSTSTPSQSPPPYSPPPSKLPPGSGGKLPDGGGPNDKGKGPSDGKGPDDKGQGMSTAAKVGIGLVAAGATTFAAPILLPIIGFSSIGPVAGSLAAAWQVTYGGAVAAGSLFSIMQSVSMAGLGVATTVMSAGAVAGGAIVLASEGGGLGEGEDAEDGAAANDKDDKDDGDDPESVKSIKDKD